MDKNGDIRIQEGELIDRRYRVERFIGKGGMGSIYAVKDLLESGRVLALKEFNLKDKDARLSLFHEFSVLARLRHINLVRVYDFGIDTDRDLPYYTAELVEGESLKALTGKLPVEDIRSIILQLLRALAYLHDRGVIHYDIKPENVIISKESSSNLPRVKLVDFGLASEAGAEKLKSARGSLPYMAPEVIEGKGADYRADLYSLGCLIYETISGHPPFGGADSSVDTIIKGHLNEVPPPLPAGTPEDLSELVKELMARNPSERPRHAAVAYQLLKTEEPFDTDEHLESYYTSSRLVGRERQMQRIESLLSSTSSPHILHIKGKEGSGRSRLLHEAEHLAQFFGFRTFRIVAGKGIWAGITGLVKQMVPFVSEDLIRLHGAAYEESIALPPDAMPVAITEESEMRDRRMEVALIFLSDVLRHHKVLLTCDDAQELDDFSLAFLQRLSAELYQKGILKRSKELKVILSSSVEFRAGFASRKKTVARMKLPALDLDSTQDMLRALLGEVEISENALKLIFRITGGLCGMIEESVRQMLLSGTLRRRELDGTWWVDETRLESIELDFFSGLIERLQELPTLTRDFADIVMLSRIPFAHTWVSQICRQAHVKPEEGRKALEHLEMLGVVTKLPEGWVPSSEMIRKKLIEAMGPERSVKLHSMLAKVFDMLGPEYATENGYHLEYAGAMGPAARAYLEAARYDRRTHAYESAKNHALIAIQIESMLNNPSSARATEALTIIADSTILTGRADEARDALETWIDKFEWKPVERARLLWWLAMAYRDLGEDGQAKKLLMDALEIAQNSSQRDGWLIVRIFDRLADLESKAGDLKSALEFAKQAYEAAIDTGDPELVCRSLNVLGNTHHQLGNIAKAKEMLSEAMQIAADNEFRNLEATYINNLALVEISLGNRERARHLFERAQGISKRFRFATIELLVSNNLGDLLMTEGKHQEAARYFEETIRSARRLNNRRLEAIGLYNLGFNATFLGRLDVALENINEALEISRQTSFKVLEALATQDLYKLYSQFGDEHKSRRMLAVMNKIIRKIDDPMALGRHHLIVAQTAYLEGDMESAWEHIRRSLQVLTSDGMPPEYGEALLYAWEIANNIGEEESAKQFESELSQHLIEHPHRRQRMHFDLIKYSHQDPENIHIDRLKRLAEQVEQEGLLELAWQANAICAEILISKADYASAYTHLISGAKAIFKITDTIPEISWRRNYFKHPRAMMLLAEYARITSDERRSFERGDEELRYRLFGEFLKLFNSVFDFDSLVVHIVDLALILTGAERGFLLLFNNDGRLETKVARSNRRDLNKERHSIPQSLIKQILKSDGPIVFRDLTKEGTLASAESIRELNLRSAIAVPLALSGRLPGMTQERRKSGAERKLGLLYVDSQHTSTIKEENIAIMGSIARLAVIALMNLKLYREATTDALTGLFLRRTFDMFLADNILTSRIEGWPLSLLMIDIDHFKKINDSHGHQTGDAVLVKLAEIMSQNFRQEDLVCRFGGEEFAVVLPRTDADTAQKVAERLRKRVESSAFPCGKVTISIGVAQLRPNESDSDLIGRADAALYAAKETGRNKVVVYKADVEKLASEPKVATILTGDPIRDQENLSALLKVVEHAADADTLEDMAEMVMDKALQVTGATRAILFGVDHDTSTPRILHWLRRAAANTDTPGPWSMQALSRVIQERKSLVILDVDSSSETTASMMSMDLKSVVVVPIFHKGKTVGVFYVDSPARTRKLATNDMLFLKALTNITSRFIAQTMKEIEEKTEGAVDNSSAPPLNQQ